MKLARTIRFDESDLNVFETPAETDEWAISGAFAFSNWTAEDLTGKARQAFANGWMGLESFGRATFVAVAEITTHEYEAQIERLAAHFVAAYGAPDIDAARGPAAEELAHIRDLCEEADPNTLLAVERELVEAGVKERFHAIRTRSAPLDILAKHGDAD